MSTRRGAASSTGISIFTAIGVAIAVQISWGFNHSIGWAILHGFFGWFYIIYRWVIGSY
ncbi:MAG TPA: hypothetical protein VE439_08315 [Anaerolineae bacterium]|nr:hypothetical protein [Anaerolineae bacterium]